MTDNIIKLQQLNKSVINKNSKNNSKINFTKAIIDNLPLPPEGMRYKYYKDEKVKGLWLYITAHGTRCFQVRKRVEGILKTQVIGEYPYINIPVARSKAFDIISAWMNGKCAVEQDLPVEEKKELSLEDAVNIYVDRHLKANSNWKNNIYPINSLVKNWGNLGKKNLSEVTKQDVLLLRDKLAGKGEIAANRALAFLRASLNYYGDYIVPQDKIGGFYNPASKIPKYKEQQRDRYIEIEELPRFFKALSNVTGDMRDLIFIALVTGARKFPVCSMQWSEIDVDKWYIPKNKQKNNESHIVPFIDVAAAILHRRKKAQVKMGVETDYVFHSSQSKHGFIQEPKKQWINITKNAELRNLRFHDLRHTLATWQSEVGVNTLTISKTLSHKLQSVTSIYARPSLESIKLAIEKAYEAMVKNVPQEIIDRIINANME